MITNSFFTITSWIGQLLIYIYMSSYYYILMTLLPDREKTCLCTVMRIKLDTTSEQLDCYEIWYIILFFYLSSYINVQEIKLVMEIIKLIKDKRKDISFRNIGIITHYKAQKTMIQKDLEKEFDKKGWRIFTCFSGVYKSWIFFFFNSTGVKLWPCILDKYSKHLWAILPSPLYFIKFPRLSLNLLSSCLSPLCTWNYRASRTCYDCAFVSLPLQ